MGRKAAETVMLVLTEKGKDTVHRFLMVAHRLDLFDLGEVVTEWTIGNAFPKLFVIDAAGESLFEEEGTVARSRNKVRR